jgi:hypothetical protein
MIHVMAGAHEDAAAPKDDELTPWRVPLALPIGNVEAFSGRRQTTDKTW